MDIDDARLAEIVRQLASATIEGYGTATAELRVNLTEVLGARAGSTEQPDWPVIPVEDLPSAPGIYVISSTEVDEHYVGLALDLRDRFHNETYGHLAPNNKSRAGSIIRSRRFLVRLPHVLEPRAALDGMLELSRLEIQTYAALVLAGCRVANSLAMLGRIGETAGIPVLLCECTSGTYAFASSIAAAGRFVGSIGLMSVVYSFQRTSQGFAARRATTAERTLLSDLVGPRGVLVGDRISAAVTREPRAVEWSGSGRNASFRWHAGPLSADDRSRLARYRRSPYLRRASPTFRAVTWNSGNRAWQCRAKYGPGRADVWHAGRCAWTPLDAAIAREEKIRAEGWERFNGGRYSSNAEAINAALGAVRFEPW